MGSDRPVAVGGRHHRAGQAAAVAARLTVADDRVVVDAAAEGERLEDAAISAVEVSVRVGSIPRRVTFPDGAVFVTDDNDGIDRLLKPAAGRDIIHHLERFHPRLIAVVAVVAILLVGVFRYGIPVLVEIAVAITPPVVPVLIGKSALTALDGSVLSDSSLPEDRRAALTADFAALAAAAHSARPLALVFRDGGRIGPNALSLPDGVIVVTDQLVKLAEDDEQIVGVLAHEIAHVELEHSLRGLYRALGISVLIMLVSGDVSELTGDVLVQGGAILSLSFSRAQERAADARGVALMRAIGRDPGAMADLLGRLSRACPACGEGSLISTHPGIAERIAEIERLAGE